MGEIRINDIIYGGVTDARDLNYDNTNSKLNGFNVQDAIDEVVDFINGVMITVNPGNWTEQADGTWVNTVAVEDVTVNKMLDVSLYGDASEDEAHAFDFLITSIDVQNDAVVFTASEKIDIALNVILRGRMDLENKNVYVSDLSAGSIEYDNSASGLNATNVQNAVDEIATMVNGLIVSVTADSWDLQEDGSYKKIIGIEGITGTEVFDVCLYPGDPHTNEQIVAFNELITGIETAEGRIILTAADEIKVAFRIFLYGKINFGQSNIVAVAGDLMEVVEMSKEEFENLSDSEKAVSGLIHVYDSEGLSAENIPYNDFEDNLGNNIQDAVNQLNKKIDSFQNGVDSIVQACIDNGSTPESNTPTSIISAINTIAGSSVEFLSSPIVKNSLSFNDSVRTISYTATDADAGYFIAYGYATNSVECSTTGNMIFSLNRVWMAKLEAGQSITITGRYGSAYSYIYKVA